MIKKILSLLLIFSLIACKTNTDNKETLMNISSSMQQEYSNPPKLIAFDDVENLREILESSNTYSEFNSWRLYKIGNKGHEIWSSNTGIIQFGTVSQNGTQNDIGYEIFGKEQNFVNEIRLTLNIKNLEMKEKALSELSLWAAATLKDLRIEEPQDLNSKILNGELYYFENDLNYIILKKSRYNEDNLALSSYSELELDKVVGVEKWELIVKSK